MSDIVAGLLITLIGMGLVFVALILLWGLMYLMVELTNRFFPDRDEQGAGEDIDAGEEVAPLALSAIPDDELRRQAAVAAVAVSLAKIPGAGAAAAAAAVAAALSIQARGNALASPSQVGSASSWQAVHRANRLSQRLNLFSRKTKRN